MMQIAALILALGMLAASCSAEVPNGSDPLADAAGGSLSADSAAGGAPAQCDLFVKNACGVCAESSCCSLLSACAKTDGCSECLVDISCTADTSALGELRACLANNCDDVCTGSSPSAQGGGGEFPGGSGGADGGASTSDGGNAHGGVGGTPQ